MDNESSQLTSGILQILDDMGQGDTLNIAKSLTTEIAFLKGEIEKGNARLSVSTAILKDTVDLIRIATQATELFKKRNTNAESVWASYWGILKECEEAICEMDSICSREV
ncbi:hypothetical protein FLAG1_08174 [Fusarium langsethiae]|uniref:Uncharacterized protein n=2 Tax=Fusarium sambucinum species complex TaxID=569360 RepID=A0A0M9ESW3_FUSLA|nr:hypothetical protein FLAG1_08174 [Fusarium langsethiae]OBS20650.1 hypothetical protein FPOA_06994 [Fusarium poae]GKU05942.1 unnamed protein product [Fusarium langsethiae]